MPQIGAVDVPLKSPAGFGGVTTLSKSAPFEFIEIENGYVNSDASEIRTFPGYVCVVDPETATRNWSLTQPSGYVANHFTARRPGVSPVGSYLFESTPTQNQYAWTRPTHIHFVEQLNSRWVFVGQSDFVREPILNDSSTGFVRISSYDDDLGTSVDLTLDQNYLTGATAVNAVAVGDRITISGLTGILATLLNDKGHIVTALPAANVVRIGTNPGGAMLAVTGQNAYIDRVTNNGLATGTTPISDDVESLTIWTCLDGGSPAGPPATTLFPAHVFNRQRDFSSSTLILKQGNRNAVTPNGGRSRRRQKSIPYRLVPHIAGNRLILAAPGYGCVFQVPGVIPPNFDSASSALGVNALCNDVFDQPRCLGIPKAVMWADPDLAPGTSVHVLTVGAVASNAFGGSSGAGSPPVNTRTGTYGFKVAYKDNATGEIGLTSEPLFITTDNSTSFQAIRIFAYFPGYLMHETGALSINLYRTTKNGTTFYIDTNVTLDALISTGPTATNSIKYGVTPELNTTEFYHHVCITPSYSTDAVLQANLGVVPEVLEQMPMGCKASRTIRGYTLFGGALGNSGSRQELQVGTITLNYDKSIGSVDAINYNRDRIGSIFTDDFSVPVAASFEGVEDGFGCAARNIPPAYSGQTIVGEGFPYPTKQVQINKLENTDCGWVGGAFTGGYQGRIQDVRYSVLDTPLRELIDLTVAEARRRITHLRLPRARLQISEPDNPNVVPATNTTVLATVRDDDIEAIGDANGQAVICTRSATYTIAFSLSPIGIPPDLASDGYGCIAPNSMTTFDGGCAWLSERGPVAWMGGIKFIGEPLEKHFTGETSKYLRDSAGMMRMAWGCHDFERKLIYFGVFANRGSATTPLTVSYQGVSYTWASAGGSADADKIRSLFPCDEVLIYSYPTGKWSFWRPPITMGIQWMTRGEASDGTARIFFLGSDKRLYTLDDAYGQGERESFKTTLVDTGTLTTLNITPTGPGSWVGLKVAIYSEDANTGEATLKGLSEIISQTGSTITLADAVAVVAGDVALIGVRSMRIETTFFNMKKTETSRAAKVGLRYQLWSRYGTGTGGSRQQAFVSASVQTEILRDGVPSTAGGSLTTDAGTPTPYRWIGQDLPDASVHEFGLKLGAGSGANHQIKATFVGGAQVRLHDLYVEVQ